MRRLFWLALGVGLGAWSLRKAQVSAQRFARTLTPESLAGRARRRVVAAGEAYRRFAHDVRVGMQAREAALREAVELDTSGPKPHERSHKVVKARYMIIDDDKDGH